MEKYMTSIIIIGMCALIFAASCATRGRTADEQRVLTDNSLQLRDWPARTDWAARAPVTSRAPLAERAAVWSARKAQP